MAISQDGVITRRRLLHFGRGASQPITLVSAPAGYGKTTLLQQWAPQTGGPVVWLDPAENTDSWHLWHQITDALSLRAVTLIIDDVHLLEGSRSSWLLKDALHLADEKRHVVIATRRDPILALHPARLAGKVREIRADDLAFDEDETRLFLAVNNIAVSSEQAHALWLHTEGWPAGLRLSTTPLSHGAHSDDAFATLLHGDTAVGSYLMGQALGYTADDVRWFLLQTSVSEFLDVELAQELTGRSDAALLLEQVHSQPGFLHRLAGGRWPYRYHPMFRALLLAELMRSSPEEVRRLSARAAAWFSKQGEHIRAAPLALQGQSWDVLSEAVLAGSCVALATGDWTWVRAEFSRMPLARREDDLSMLLSSVLVSIGTGARMEALALLSAILDGRPRPRTRQQADVVRFLRGWWFAERGQPELAVRILEIDPHYDPTSGSTAASHALKSKWHELHAACLLLEGPSNTAVTMLNESNASSAVTYTALQLGALEIRAWEAIVAGDLRSAQQQLDRADALLASESDQSTLDQGATIWPARQWLEMETEIQAVAAPDHLETTPARSAFPHPIGQALETITDARMRLIRNTDSLGCALMLDELIVTNPQVPEWWTTGCLWAIVRIDAHLAAGEVSEALDLTFSSSPANGFDDGTHNQSYLRAWVMQRVALESEAHQVSFDLDQLISNLPLESALLPGRSEALRVRVLLGAASLALRAEKRDHASQYLRLALHSTEMHGWRRPYGEIAAAIIPVLEAERRRITAYGEQVVELLAYLRQQPVSGVRLPDPLSVRELEILQYLPTPLDQRELCSALFISRNTLKTHLRSTYRKLGVQTRREAVLQAERLGIL
ncbi:MAG TPA: LuxR C-terminal-related transcriptional regulator [Propionibacteriaceae bacterium]|nr:LuxR C-terminal-related transcriptional regulator [Propionibacteriaceae bacterium]